MLLHKANIGMQELLELIEDGKVIPVIDRTYPLNKIADALHYFSKGQVVGKVVVTLD